MSEICIGPNGGCAQCYHRPCICNETAEQRETRLARIRHEQKQDTAHGREITLLDCEHCPNGAVVADDVTRAYTCLRCGWQQKPKWTPKDQREPDQLAAIHAQIRQLVEQWQKKATPMIDDAKDAEGKGMLITAASLNAQGCGIRDCATELAALLPSKETRT